MAGSKITEPKEINGLTFNKNSQASIDIRHQLKNYYYLTKPGIVYSNMMTGASGYLFATKFHIKWLTLITFLIGMGLIIASACVFNNILDKSIDAKMTRTKKRALVSGVISPKYATVFGLKLGIIGFILLAFTNWLTFLIAVLAYFSYIVLYGISKRRTVHGTLVGTLPGAASLVAGYTLYINRLDLVALSLLLIMISWQMAHFYSIAIYRLNDYKNASLPVWPVLKGIYSTKRLIIIYIVLFSLLAPLTLLIAGGSYLTSLIMLVICIYWLKLAVISPSSDDNSWARQLFLKSLIVITSFSILLPLSSLVP